jgi:hypothetical protein
MFRGRSVSAGLAVIAFAGVSCLAVTACGTAASSPSAAPAASTAAPSPVDPLAALTPSQVQTEAYADLKAASSMTIEGNVNKSDTNYTLNLGIKPGHGCAGTIGEGSLGSLKLIVIGKVAYLNPDTTFWKALAGAEAPAVIAVVKGRYVKGITSAPGTASITRLCDLTQIIGSTVPVTASKGAVTSMDGIRVLPLEGSGNSVMYVTDTSKPEIVQMQVPGNGTGTGAFAVSVGAPVTLTPPPASQVFEGSLAGL